MMPNAVNIIEGGSVIREGYRAGTIDSVEVVDGKAKVVLDLDDEFGKLHDGVRVDVAWKGTIGERLVTVTDGPRKNAEIPSGALLTNVASEPVEIAEVMSALEQINGTTTDHETDMKAALTTAGPAVEQLGAMLADLGADGEAIRQILTQSNRTMTILADRQRTLSHVVGDLSDMSESVVTRHKELGETLETLPDVIEEGEKTFKAVPDAVDEAVPLLEDLEPATDKLASTSKHLKPVLQDLRPAVQDLRPALGSLAALLNETPAMMDAGTSTFPAINRAITTTQPMVRFLRPYTPEVVGWLSNWASLAGNYDSNGHYARFHIINGAESVIPAVPAASQAGGVSQNLRPKPGEPVGQAWEDAYGDGLR
jgi:phospholipid/cholesterol/gamma-HCH transport system substrate-binding protein